MSQMGGGLTNWRKRYFELLGCQLHAFNTETNNLVMTLDLALVKAIKACGVVATVTPKSQRSVGVDEDDEDKIDLTSENSIEVSRSFSESPVRRGILTATSNVDDATFCRSAHMFEIEMKDGELISFSTLGALDDEDDLPSQNNSRSVSLPRNEPWWKSGGISSPDDTFPCEPMDCVAPMLHKNFLDSDFDEVFEDIHITSPDCSARRSGFLESRGKLRDDTAPLTKRWLRAICCAATTACDETLPDWLTHY
ncbi:hypothetical protein BC830DRAFT_1112746 [Chytriomyces sp. MP71]|nr:hypothetical protein BC830DRAFT_1112746 [Chytriomyces sp. MP71]